MGQTYDATQFPRSLARAKAASVDGHWDDAVALWQRVVEANPVDGRFWGRLGDARYHTQQYAEAIPAYQRALDLGVSAYFGATDHGQGFPFDLAYRIACCQVGLGDNDAGIVWLERALDLGYRDLTGPREDEALRPLHEYPRFAELLGIIDPAGMSREEGWRYDLALAAREVRRRMVDPHRLAREGQFDAELTALEAAVPELTDAQIYVGLRKLIRLVGDGHSVIGRDPGRVDLMLTLPVQFALFQEGLYIVAAPAEHAGLLGAQVRRIGEHTVDAALAAIEPLISRDNSQWVLQLSPYVLRETPVLHALGLLDEPDQATLTLEYPDGATEPITLAADLDQPTLKLWYAFPCPPGWAFLPATLPSPLPLYLRCPYVNYWFTYLPQERAVYFQFNRVRDDPEEPFAEFTARLFGFIAAQPVEKLVIDLRWNNGGNTFLERPFLHRLIGDAQVNRRGSLFVIIGRRTYSAAQNFATMLEMHTEATFAGEPSGSCPNFAGETSEVRLPWSNIVLNVSDLYWQTSWPTDYRTWIPPLLYAPPTFARYRENRDTALEAVLACDARLPMM